ncbi:MAG: hypothetical protein RL318_1652 [Fibrobacterota bacterium]
MAGATVGAVAVVGWLVFDKVIMPRVIGRGTPLAKVPSVVGKTPEEAREILREAGLEPILDPELKRSERIEKGLIAVQTPIPGDEVKAGHSVRFWTSAGKVSIAVPEVKGQDSAKAARALEEAGLALDSASHELDSSLAAGKVLRTNPVAGATLAPGAKVRLIVSLGTDTTTKVDSTKAKGLF